MTNIKSVVSSIIFLVLLCIFSCVCLPLSDAFHKDVPITLLFLFIGIFSSIGMTVNSQSRAFSIRFVFYFYCFSFMFCAGITQFATGKFCWEFRPATEEVQAANLYIILFLIIFSISNVKIFKEKNAQKKFSLLLHKQHRFKIIPFMLIEIVLLVCGLYAIIRGGGIKMLFSRESFSAYSFSSIINNTAINQIVSAAITSSCIFCMVLSLNQLKIRKGIQSVLLVGMAAVAMFINVPPLAVPRFSFVCAYGGIFLYFSKWIKKGRRFAYILAFGLLIVFPALNAFRFASGKITLEMIQASMGKIGDNFTNADYDSYTMLVYCLRYVNVYGITYGSQLLGALLFFVPRNIWGSKPMGSGSLIIKSLAPSYINQNVSCSFIGEGYLNWGGLGVCVFAFLLSKISKKADDLYWEKERYIDGCFKNIYSYTALFSLFLFRGDLMSSTAFLTGMIVVTIFLSYLFREQSFVKINK